MDEDATFHENLEEVEGESTSSHILGFPKPLEETVVRAKG